MWAQQRSCIMAERVQGLQVEKGFNKSFSGKHENKNGVGGCGRQKTITKKNSSKGIASKSGIKQSKKK